MPCDGVAERQKQTGSCSKVLEKMQIFNVRNGLEKMSTIVEKKRAGVGGDVTCSAKLASSAYVTVFYTPCEAGSTMACFWV